MTLEVYSAVVSVPIICASWLFGTDPTNLQWLVVLLSIMLFDMVLGTGFALREGTFKRQILLAGIFRKVSELVLISAGRMCDIIQFAGDAIMFQRIVTGYLIAYELLSVLQYVKRNGTPIPSILQEKITEFLNRSGGENRGD